MYLNGAYYDRYPATGVVPMRMPQQQQQQPTGTSSVVVVQAQQQQQQQPPQWTATTTAASAVAPGDHPHPPPPPPTAGMHMATTTTMTTMTPTTAQPPPPAQQQQQQQLFSPSHASNKNNNTTNSNTSNNNNESTYVLRIHEMLENAEREHHQHIVSWQPHGRAFKVHDEVEFVATILPRYFKAKIGSFRRWLRAWGFERMTEGPDRGGWYHRYFVRGMTSFCKQMTRQQMLQAMDDWLPPGQVPDFYNASSSAALSEQQQTQQPSQQPPQVPTTTLVTNATMPHQNTNNNSFLDHSNNHNDMDNDNGLRDDIVVVELSHAKNPKKLRGTVLEDLRDMLHDTEVRGEQAIASWMSHGKAFKIHDKEAFAAHVMPRHFKTGKLTYFSDTLRIWGFCRFKRPGKDRNAYYHKYFVRGDPSLSRHKSREQMKKAMAHWPPPEGEPNLYEEEEADNDISSSFLVTTATQQQQQAQQQQIIKTKRGPSANGSSTRPMTKRGAPKSVTARGSTNRPAATTAAMVARVALNATHDDIPQGKQGLDEAEQQLLMFDAAATDPLHHLQDANSHQDAEHQLLPPDLYYDAAVHHPTEASTPLGAAERAVPIDTTMMMTAPDDGKSGDGTYVLRIHEMLENAEKEGYQHIVSWQPHGRAFRVHKEEEFIESIMPRYFKAKIDSFRRWLRAWGFNRMTEGRDRGAWYHRYFVRGVTSLCQTMTRQQMLHAMENWLPAGQVPDFYAPGTTMALSEDPSRVFDQTTAAGSHDPADPNGTAFIKNPKKLRGTVPEDLRTMLQDAQYEGNENIVSWLSHGRAFKVHNKNQFVQKIMPRYFKATKFTYFSDTLRIWGFARLKKVPKDRGAYYHCKFVRGDAALSRHLSREQMKNAMANYPPPGGVEPDLYTLTGGMARVEAFATTNVTPVSPPVPPPPPPPRAVRSFDVFVQLCIVFFIVVLLTGCCPLPIVNIFSSHQCIQLGILVDTRCGGCRCGIS
jgi:hypothetical protein